MKILMVYPEMPDNVTNSRALVRFAGRKSIFPPLGLLTVAALLPAEWEKKLIDLNVESLSAKDIQWADYVFISAMNVQSKSAEKIIRVCQECGAKIVAGGPLFTHEYERFEDVDYFVLNEAELTLPMFLNDLNHGEAKHIYSTNEFADIRTTPVPMWELVNVNQYLYSIVQYSRGCPYLCDFCDVTALYGRVPRVKTPQQIIYELDQLMASGNIESILFADDNLIGNKNILKKELLPALIEWRSRNPYAPAFTTQATITLADDEELCHLMLEAGFRHILIGIESVHDASFLAMKKKQNAGRNLLETVKYLQHMGFIIIGTFIVGFDTDTKAVFDDISNFIQESGIIYVIVNVLKAPPGTELYKRMKRENRLLPQFEFDEDKTNIIPVMNPADLHEGYKKILLHTYSPAGVLQRILQYLHDRNKNFKVTYPVRRKTRAYDVVFLLKIIWTIGIVHKERKYFWKLLARTAKTDFHMLDFALFYSTLMYQYNSLLKTFLRKKKRE